MRDLVGPVDLQGRVGIAQLPLPDQESFGWQLKAHTTTVTRDKPPAQGGGTRVWTPFTPGLPDTRYRRKTVM
ncbi:hypothetical protein GCM10028793_21410 [Nocardiopsis oceani]